MMNLAQDTINIIMMPAIIFNYLILCVIKCCYYWKSKKKIPPFERETQ